MQSQTQHFGGAAKVAPDTPHAPESIISGEALSILREGRDAILATLRPDGWPQATVINYVHDEERVFFDCATDSQKFRNIARDDRVSLALVVPYPAFGPIFGLSLAGHAKVIEYPGDTKHVLSLWRERYPYMKERLEQDLAGFAFYAIVPIVVTTLDYAAGLGHRHNA